MEGAGDCCQFKSITRTKEIQALTCHLITEKTQLIVVDQYKIGGKFGLIVEGKTQRCLLLTDETVKYKGYIVMQGSKHWQSTF